jgi:L-asparaginase
VSSDGIVVFTLGGTIAMTGQHGGVMTRLGGRDLLAGIAGLAGSRLVDGVGIEVRDLRAVPSADLSFADILDVADAARAAVAGGARGVVVVQGTDTLEETAFLASLVWDRDEPLVLTGAMRNPTLAGPDGPANLLAAFQVAAGQARGRGVLVVLSDEIHTARHVRKSHSVSTAAFTSPDLGPVGRVIEGTPRFLAAVPAPMALPAVSGLRRDRLAATRVALYTVTLDDDGLLLPGLAGSHHGLVVAGFGVGHVPGALAPVLGDLAAAMPVVLTTRAGAGPVLASTYGAAGSERDLRARGLIGAGVLHPFKARVLLRLLVAAGVGRDQVAAAFAELG